MIVVTMRRPLCPCCPAGRLGQVGSGVYGAWMECDQCGRSWEMALTLPISEMQLHDWPPHYP